MDKLELDARVARVERRVSFLFALALLGLVAAGLGITFAMARTQRVAMAQRVQMDTLAAARVMPPTPPHDPPPTPSATVVDLPPTPGGMGMGMAMPDNSFGPGRMGIQGPLGYSLQELMTVRQLLQEKTITAEDWEAKKAQIMSKPIVAGNLRNDLQAVQMLWENKALTDAERDAFKQHLLGLVKPGDPPSHGPDEAVKALDK